MQVLTKKKKVVADHIENYKKRLVKILKISWTILTISQVAEMLKIFQVWTFYKQTSMLDSNIEILSCLYWEVSVNIGL